MIEQITLNNTESEDIKMPFEEAERMFNETIVDIDKIVKRPPYAITIGNNNRGYPQKLATLGNISMLMGAEKSRKSFVKSLLEAGTIGGSANYNNDTAIIGHLGDKLIISIDTEQGEYDVWQNANRVKKMVNAPIDNYRMVGWREKSILERNALLDYLFNESPHRHNLGLVILDGYVDFVHNSNDQKESNLFVGKLMKYSSQANCHIMGILHTNPKNPSSPDAYAKGRGALGTILQQKCEMVALVEQGEDNEFSKVSCYRLRGEANFKTFAVRIDKESRLPFITDFEEAQSRY